MLVIAPLIIGFVLALATLSSKRDMQEKTDASWLGCLASFALAVTAIVTLNGALTLYRWLRGLPLQNPLDEWIAIFAVPIFGFAGLGWLIGGIVAHFIKAP